MKFYLPSEKEKKTYQLCKALQKDDPTSLHLLAQLLAFLESCRPAIRLASLHYRRLQSSLIQQVTLNNGPYQGTVNLNKIARKKLHWWIANIHQLNGSPICPPTTEMTITSDASKIGWGVTCGNLSTRGLWSHPKQAFYVNLLVLKAAFLAIRTFLKQHSNMSVKLRLDNTTAVSYINNQGGTRSPIPMSITLNQWNWCLQHKVFIRVEYPQVSWIPWPTGSREHASIQATGKYGHK